MRKKAENIAAHIPNLVVRANKIAESVWTGFHSKKKVGPGEAFWQFRKYEQGDPAHLIDWRKTAKTNEIFIQERELETLQNIVLWRDNSASMHYSSNNKIEKKIDRANLLTLALSIIISKSGENISLNGHSKRPLRGKLSIDYISEKINKDAKNTSKKELDYTSIKNSSNVLLIGDFLNSISHLESVLKRLSNKNVNAIFIRIYDPSENTLPFTGRVNFNRLDKSDSILIGNVDSIRPEYIKKIENHYKKLKEIILSYSWNYISHSTNNKAEEALREIYLLLSKQNRKNK